MISHEEQIMGDVRSMVQALRISSRKLEKQIGLSLAQLQVLYLLTDGRAVTLNELAAATQTHQSSVSVVVQRLVDQGLVTRDVDAKDKRCVRIAITGAGRGRVAVAPATVERKLVSSLRHMEPAQVALLARYFRAFVQPALGT